MNEQTRRGLHALEAALLLGLLGDALLRATPWGLNFFLWTCAGTAAVVALLTRWRRAALKGAGGALLLPVVLCAGAFAWRDSATLLWLDALTIAVALGLLAWRTRGASVRLAALSDYARGLLYAGAQTIFGGVPLVFWDVRWREIPRGGWTRHAFAALRGLLIAVPLLLVFGALFVAADAVFARLVSRTFNFDVETLGSHFFVTAFCSWIAAGYLRGLLFNEARPANEHGAQSNVVVLARAVVASARVVIGRVLSDARASTYDAKAPTSEAETPTNDTTTPLGDTQTTARGAHAEIIAAAPNGAATGRQLALGAVEIGVVLGLLDALFLGFVCVQVRYLFGGAAWIAATGGLTYAEYARRGFFELVWAAALVLPLLLALHWLLRADDARAERLFRILALAQIALLFVVIASALTRMRLYQREYGLTELRLYTTAFMGWLALVFLWFAATVLRGARARFACGALVAAGLIVGALHLLNPDETIVRVNVAHARAGRTFDAAYASTLSADAVPALVRALPALASEQRCFAARRLLDRWAGPTYEDWRSWNVARSAARRAVLEQEATMRAWDCVPPDESTPVWRLSATPGDALDAQTTPAQPATQTPVVLPATQPAGVTTTTTTQPGVNSMNAQPGVLTTTAQPVSVQPAAQPTLPSAAPASVPTQNMPMVSAPASASTTRTNVKTDAPKRPLKPRARGGRARR